MTRRNDVPRRGWRARLAQVEPKPPWGLWDVLNSFFMLFLSMVIVGTLIAQVLFTLAGRAQETGLILALSWALGGALGGGLLLFLRRRRAAEWEALRFVPTAQPAIFAVLLGIGFGILIDLVVLAGAGGAAVIPELRYAADFTVFGWVLIALFLLLVQPFAEELLFRGMLHPYFRAVLGAWPGLVLTAILYALFHLLLYGDPIALNQGSAWREVIAPFVGGLLLGGVRAISGSTRTAAFVHVGMGAFALMGALVLLNG